MGKIKNYLQGIRSGKRAFLWFTLLGIAGTIFLSSLGNRVINYTSTDSYCMSCHVHPHAENSWKLGAHHNNRTGVIVHCTDCHLPPKGHGYLYAKAKHGMTDLYGYLFKDTSEYHWESKRTVEKADKFVYQESCIKCHQNLFPATLSKDGDNAHLYFLTNNDQNLRCINCHLHVGHFDRNAKHEHNLNFGAVEENKELYAEATKIDSFKNFTEKVPGTSIAFDMVAVPGGTFKMGSPKDEPLRDDDEGPVRAVKVSSFWMGKVEVSWDEYLTFFKATSSQGRTEGQTIKPKNVDAISGPTPPWGAPDQGWGKGSRPAITMSWHAASVYCEWLSKVTGKKYRLPTEAEWEYAARGGTSKPYFFEGDPKKFTSGGLLKKIFGTDTSNIASKVIYKENSFSRTQEPEVVGENPFGLKNMLGNVSEFCSDYYAPTAYQGDKGKLIVDPKGPRKGSEHVIRGGSYKSDAKDTRCAARDYTRTKEWLMTDPQMPKSIWWYSDCIDVGFRVVCETEPDLLKK
ncbi:MAG: SUMF1/EgtB/PvdO family nonheme iron enzyme [Bacteroidales bacterium]|nr:SUMF1/EgtB/PvdO family nonheme iron enzyme [Bacteroidales bacterium]